MDLRRVRNLPTWTTESGFRLRVLLSTGVRTVRERERRMARKVGSLYVGISLLGLTVLHLTENSKASAAATSGLNGLNENNKRVSPSS